MRGYDSGDGVAMARREADRPARRATCIGRSSIMSWYGDVLVSNCSLHDQSAIDGCLSRG